MAGHLRDGVRYGDIRSFECARTSAVMPMILVVVTAIDMVSAQVRKVFP
jgi:ABC-type phosphate/phosphonate transport system permease subunit